MPPAILVDLGLEAVRQPRRLAVIGDVAGWASHAGAPAVAGVRPIPWPSRVVLADPPGVRAEDTSDHGSFTRERPRVTGWSVSGKHIPGKPPQTPSDGCHDEKNPKHIESAAVSATVGDVKPNTKRGDERGNDAVRPVEQLANLSRGPCCRHWCIGHGPLCKITYRLNRSPVVLLGTCADAQRTIGHIPPTEYAMKRLKKKLNEEKCPVCNGRGAPAYTSPEPGRRIYAPECSRCHGSGRILVVRQTEPHRPG